MKKLICLFLMLWLPLFTGSAWAMSAQMQLDRLHIVAPMTDMKASTAQPCHEMQAEKMASPQARPAGASGDEYPHGQHCNGHDCFACGVCLYATSYTSPSQPAVFIPALSNANPEQPQQTFASQGYPPALKPPISI